MIPSCSNVGSTDFSTSVYLDGGFRTHYPILDDENTAADFCNNSQKCRFRTFQRKSISLP